MPIRPVIMETEDAETIWQGIKDAHPVDIFRYSIVLVFVVGWPLVSCSGHSANPHVLNVSHWFIDAKG